MTLEQKNTDTDAKSKYKDLIIMGLYSANILELSLYRLLMSCIKVTQKSLPINELSYSPIIDENANTSEIFKRVQTFFPERKYAEFNLKVRKAIRSRNKFIHGIFFERTDDSRLPKVQEILQINIETLKKVTVWLNDYMEAGKEIVAYMKTLKDLELKQKKE